MVRTQQTAPVTPRELRRTLDPELISAAQMPVVAMRYAETWHKARLFEHEDRAVGAAYRLYQAAFADIRQSARDYADQFDLTHTGQDKASVTWKRAVMDTVRPRLTQMADDLALGGLDASVVAYYAGYYTRMWLLEVGTRPDVRIQMPSLSFPQVANAVASTLRESALQEQAVGPDVYRQLIRSLLGREWRAQYAVQLDRLTADIEIALSSGMSSGEGIDDIMRRVRDVMGVSTDRRTNAPDVRANFNRIEALTRTVVNKASNDGAWLAYNANSDILSGYQWLTAKDERVCLDCRSYDLQTYALSDYFRPPAHPRCRCTIIPVIADRVLTWTDETPRMSFADFLLGAGAGLFTDSILNDFLGTWV